MSKMLPSEELYELNQNFSSKVKTELIQCPISKKCCYIANLSALIHTAGSLVINRDIRSVIISTENPLLISLLDNITKKLYNCNCDIDDSHKVIEISLSGEFLLEMLLDCAILSSSGEGISIESGISPKLVNNICCKGEYIKGAFLGGGSVMVGSNYHLEFVLSSARFARDLSHVLAEYDILSKIIQRKDKHVVYIKDSQSISDCLALMGASKSVLDLNNLMVDRQMRREINRTTNCINANIDKAISASMTQIDAINRIRARDSHILSPKLKEMADLRIENPDWSYEQLAERMGISKSGVKHRLVKLIELASTL